MNRFFILPLMLFSMLLNAGYVADTDVTFKNQEVMMLEFSSNSIDLGEIKPDMKEILKIKGLSVRVKSNVDWVLTVEPLDNLTSIEGYSIDIERFQFKTGKGDFEPFMMNKPSTIASGKPTQDSGENVSLDFKLKINWDDPAGRYTTKLRFTLNSLY
ncbi:MAG: hypothetical protein PHW02_06110 [bacterium]|nr:hypothetical protein [bacterium]